MATTDLNALLRQRQLLNQMPATTGQQNMQQLAAAAAPTFSPTADITKLVSSEPSMVAPPEQSNAPQAGALGRAFMGGLTSGASGAAPAEGASAAQNIGQGLGARARGLFQGPGTPTPGTTGPADPLPSQTPTMKINPQAGLIDPNTGLPTNSAMQLPTIGRAYNPNNLGMI